MDFQLASALNVALVMWDFTRILSAFSKFLALSYFV